MKIDPGKGWPYPVLQPPEYGDDYPKAEFEVDIELKRSQDCAAVDMTAIFDLSDPDLLQLVRTGSAKYVLLVKSPETHYRKEFRSDKPRIEQSFKGELSGRTEFSSFLVCVAPQKSFTARGWHSDFAGLSFDLMPGFVLAQDKPKEYWIDAANEAPISSILELQPGGIQDGLWDCLLDKHRVQIRLSEADCKRLKSAREKANNTPEGQYLMNGLFLPVLVHVLNEADKNPDEYSEYRWFDSLDNRLEALGLKSLGSNSSNRAVDAQKVLEHPFIKMPIIAEANDGP